MIYDYDQTIELLQRAVAEKGDGHTCMCYYAGEGGQPVCIVGHVLSYVGLLSAAKECDQIGIQPDAIVDQFTPAAISALAEAQHSQDTRHTWGEALIAAKEVAP